jgi:hypothetical protein
MWIAVPPSEWDGVQRPVSWRLRTDHAGAAIRRATVVANRRIGDVKRGTRERAQTRGVAAAMAASFPGGAAGKRSGGISSATLPQYRTRLHAGLPPPCGVKMFLAS